MGIKSLAPFVSWSGQVPAIPARRKGPESRHPACSDPDRILLIRRKANPPLSMTRCSRTIRSASLRPKGQLPMRLTRRVDTHPGDFGKGGPAIRIRQMHQERLCEQVAQEAEPPAR